MTLDQLIVAQFTPLLLEKGFKRRGRKYRRVAGGFEHVVSIEKGQRGLQGKFCISLYAHPLIDGPPGLPKRPLRLGDHWLSQRLAPAGFEDKWWVSDEISGSGAKEIIGLITNDLDEWFSETENLEVFAEGWVRRLSNLDCAAKHLGLLPARLAYLHAIVFAEMGETTTALKVADTASENTGNKAVTLRAWIKTFRQTINPID